MMRAKGMNKADTPKASNIHNCFKQLNQSKTYIKTPNTDKISQKNGLSAEKPTLNMVSTISEITQ